MRPIPKATRVAAALAGDPEALDDVLRDWLPTVYAWCARLGAGRIDSEEAAHDVLLIFVRRRASIGHSAQVPSFLFSTCRRVVANHRRHAWWKRWLPGATLPEPSSTNGLDEAIEQRQLADQVDRTLNKLSDAHRAVLVLCYLEERTVTEASELLGVPEGTVKSRLHHARNLFRRSFSHAEAR